MSDLGELAEEVMETARDAGATDAIAEAFETSVRQVRFSNSQIDAVNSWTERHVALFVAVGRHIMSSDLRDFGSATERAPELVSLARSTPPSKTYGGIAKGRFSYRRARADPAVIRLANPSRYVHEAISAAESAGSSNVGGTFYVRHERVALSSSGGPRGSDENTAVELSVRAFSQPEASGHAVCCAHALRLMKAKETGERAGQLASMARDPMHGTEGRTDLVLEPLCLGSFTQPTTSMLSALRVELSTSMFAKKVGRRVASDVVTLADDPTIPSTSRRSFDHEGVPTRRNVMIENGILKTYLHNTSTAKRFKTKTTGSAGPLIPTPFTYAAQPIAMHPVLQPGDWSEQELIEDTRRGLYLNNTWYTRFQNYASGDFSTIPRDAILRIENGEIVGAVKNIRISDNMLNFWMSVDALSKSTQEIYWWDEAAPPSTLPAVRVRGMTITRSA